MVPPAGGYSLAFVAGGAGYPTNQDEDEFVHVNLDVGYCARMKKVYFVGTNALGTGFRQTRKEACFRDTHAESSVVADHRQPTCT